MDFAEKIDKLIAEATANRQAADARLKKLLDERNVVNQAINAVVEKQLGIVGELRALETVRKDATDRASEKGI